ncbi:hypothetical protein [Lysobacter sp. Root604]|uniref:hypothetical protein n=1 Tax=Lysobacter sp. Root604 TaxID=1736568 RepID=UPI000700DCF9|nr:hypothetical protein [Lysobacter sp. Root604]KRA20813.1 hypothetical protein ASD69_05775 [Lysobacter sp. Root604]
MEEKSALEKYQALLVDWVAPRFTPEMLKGNESMPADECELMDIVFQHFTELTDCVDRLDLCLAFIKAPMPRRKGLKADDYLMYHITFYFQEVYILNERFESYAKSVLRLRKKRIGLEGVNASPLDGLLERIRVALSSVVLVRGKHVHARAFRDEEMKELSTFSFLAIHAPERNEWRALHRQLYSVARKTWVKRLTNNRESITKLLNEFCELMHEIVAGGDRSLLPNNSFKPKPLRGSA